MSLLGGSLEISYLFIFACCRKIVAITRKSNGCNSIIMANQCVNWTSLKQIQNFCRPIIAAGDHNISAGMECNRIDRLQMDIVQLNQFGGSPIENFNLATAECNCNQWTVWMPCHIVTYTMKLHNQIYDRAMNLWFRFSMAAYHAHCHVRQMFVHNRRYSHQTISMYDLLSTMQSFCHSVNTVHNLHDSCAPKTIVKIALFRCSTIWRLCLRLRSPIFDLLDEIPHCGRRTMLEMCTMYREWLAPTPEMRAMNFGILNLIQNGKFSMSIRLMCEEIRPENGWNFGSSRNGCKTKWKKKAAEAAVTHFDCAIFGCGCHQLSIVWPSNAIHGIRVACEFVAPNAILCVPQIDRFIRWRRCQLIGMMIVCHTCDWPMMATEMPQ